MSVTSLAFVHARFPPKDGWKAWLRALILAFLLAGNLAAQVWTGALSTTWSTTGNWSTGVVPGGTATATFSSNTARDPNLTAAATVGKLLFSSGTDAEIFTGSALTLNGISSLGIDNQSGVTQTFNNTLIVGAAQTWNADSGDFSFAQVTLNNNLTLTGSTTFTFGGTLLLNGGNRTLTNNATGTVTLSGGVTGNTRTLTVAGTGDTAITGAIATTTGGLIKTGTGTLTLSGANTNTGTTTIGTSGGTSGGTLRTGASNILANATTTVYAGTLDLNGNSETIGALTLGGGASGTSATVTTGAGTLTLGGNITYTATNNPDGAAISGNLALGGANRTFTINNSTAATDDLTVSAVISGSNAITKSGTGTLVLSGANTYTGATTVSAGVLNIQNASALGTTGNGTTGATGAALQLQGGIAVGAEALSITGTGISSTGALRNISGDNSWAGLVTLTGAATFAADAGSLTFSGSVTGTNRNLTVTGAGDTSITGGLTTGTGTLLKTGTGTLTLSGTSTYTGATTMGAAGGTSGGTLRTGASNVLSNATTTVYAGTLDLNGNSDTIGALTLGGGASGTSATVATGAGTLTLGGNVTYTATNNPDGAAISGNLALGGANRTFTINNSTAATDDLTVSAVISGSNAITKSGTGTLVLSGANTYTGTTSVSAGVLNIRHSQALGSTAAGTTVTTGEELQLQGGISVGAEALSIMGTGVSSTGALRNISGSNSYGGAITLTGNTQFTADSGDLTLTGGVTGTNRNLTVTGAGDTAISSAITTGSGTLTKSGSGTLTLSGANTYTGATTVSAGVLNIQNASALGTTGSGTTVSSGAALQLQGGISVGAEALSIAGTGVGSTGALRNISGGNSYAGAITLTGATTIASDAGTLTLSGGVTGTNQNLTVVSASDTAITGAITTGTGTLTKQGTGTLTLSGTSTYTGATNIDAGTLLLGASNVLSNSTAVTITSGATFDVNDQTETIATIAGGGTVDLGVGILIAAGNGSTTFSGTLAGTGSFTKQGTGILTLDNSFDFGGTFNLAGGTLRLSDMTLTLGTLNITGNSIIDFSGVSTLDVTNFNISGGVTLTIQNWADMSDYFFAQNWTGATYEVRGAAPMNQVTFTGFTADDTKWQSYDKEVTPVPEPSAYGAFLLAAAGGWLFGRRRFNRRAG